MAQSFNGESGHTDVSIPNVATVGDAQTVFYRQQDEIEMLKRTITNLEQHLARVTTQGPMYQNRIELVHVKTMSPEQFNGDRSQDFNLG